MNVNYVIYFIYVICFFIAIPNFHLRLPKKVGNIARFIIINLLFIYFFQSTNYKFIFAWLVFIIFLISLILDLIINKITATLKQKYDYVNFLILNMGIIFFLFSPENHIAKIFLLIIQVGISIAYYYLLSLDIGDKRHKYIKATIIELKKWYILLCGKIPPNNFLPNYKRSISFVVAFIVLDVLSSLKLPIGVFILITVYWMLVDILIELRLVFFAIAVIEWISDTRNQRIKNIFKKNPLNIFYHLKWHKHFSNEVLLYLQVNKYNEYSKEVSKIVNKYGLQNLNNPETYGLLVDIFESIGIHKLENLNEYIRIEYSKTNKFLSAIFKFIGKLISSALLLIFLPFNLLPFLGITSDGKATEKIGEVTFSNLNIKQINWMGIFSQSFSTFSNLDIFGKIVWTFILIYIVLILVVMILALKKYQYSARLSKFMEAAIQQAYNDRKHH